MDTIIGCASLFGRKQTEDAVKGRIRNNFVFAGKLAGKTLSRERELYLTKWFDYRFMSPLEATQLFVKEYQLAYRSRWATDHDREQAEKKIGIRANDWLSSDRERTSFWHARQAADLIGAPYTRFIRDAMEAASRRGARRPPRPNQLFDRRTCNYVRDQWQEWKSDRFLISELPQYRNKAFCGLQAQIDHQNWVVELIRLQHCRPFLIGQSCFIRQILPVERAVTEFGSELVERGRQDVMSDDVDPETKPTKAELLPSCFGVPHACSLDSELCATCPLVARCRALNDLLKARLMERLGSDDPVAARKREENNARVRRHREKKRNEAHAMVVVM